MMSSEIPRDVHFIGSIQAPDTSTAMDMILRGAEGLQLNTIPDGETGNRQWWVGRVIYGQYRNPNLELLRDGKLSSYDDVPVFGVRQGQQLTPDSLGLDFTSQIPESNRIRQEKLNEYGRQDIPLQVGIINPVDSALFSMGIEGAKYIETFAKATQKEIRNTWELLGPNGVMQIESPAALRAAMGTSDIPKGFTVEEAMRWVGRLAGDSPKGSRFIVHLCLGDMNGETLTGHPLTDGTTVVRAAKALMRYWPTSRPAPEQVHFPVAGGRDEPLLDTKIYAGLRGLRNALPPETRIAAGIAHEGDMHDPEGSFARQREALRLVEHAVGPVSVAAACGIARGRTAEATVRVIEQMAKLARS
jgi:hypothetical protein